MVLKTALRPLEDDGPAGTKRRKRSTVGRSYDFGGRTRPVQIFRSHGRPRHGPAGTSAPFPSPPSTESDVRHSRASHATCRHKLSNCGEETQQTRRSQGVQSFFLIREPSRGIITRQPRNAAVTANGISEWPTETFVHSDCLERQSGHGRILHRLRDANR